MSYELEYIWQREKPYTHVPNFLVLYRAYRDNYAEFARKDFHSLTSKQQKHWDDLGGKLIKAWDLARKEVYSAGKSLPGGAAILSNDGDGLEDAGLAPVPSYSRPVTKGGAGLLGWKASRTLLAQDTSAVFSRPPSRLAHHLLATTILSPPFPSLPLSALGGPRFLLLQVAGASPMRIVRVANPRAIARGSSSRTKRQSVPRGYGYTRYPYHTRGKSVAKVFGAWGIPPLRAVPKEKKPRTRRAKPYDREMWKPVARARAACRQAGRSQSQPPVIIPPPRRTLYSVSALESVSKGGEGERKGSASDGPGQDC
ncbi:hypothetical protein BDZ89DRAFT_1047819 [Hymenopellis radicata]|nr:hypothetical protein BDZ89DRAFT_1047819 [Hymenopellis radicata]